MLKGKTEVLYGSIESWLNIEYVLFKSHPNFYAENWYFNGEPVTSIVIPDGITGISDFAFCNCTGLTSVYAPSSLKEIGNDAFPNHEGMILYCYPNSEAERYGNENGIHVELLEGSGSVVLP